HDPRLHRRVRCHGERGRRLHDHRPHAAHVQGEARARCGSGESEGALVSPFISLAYLVASILFILCLRGLSSPESARRGIFLGELGMLLAVVATLLHKDIVSYEWI